MSHPSKRCRLSREARQPGRVLDCDLAPGPACLADFGVKFARDSANSLLEGHEPRRQLLRMHLRKTLILDSVFTGMAAWEDAVRIYLNAAADMLEVPRPKIIHRTACDCDPTALMVLEARSQQLRHSAPEHALLSVEHSVAFRDLLLDRFIQLQSQRLEFAPVLRARQLLSPFSL